MVKYLLERRANNELNLARITTNTMSDPLLRKYFERQNYFEEGCVATLLTPPTNGEADQFRILILTIQLQISFQISTIILLTGAIDTILILCTQVSFPIVDSCHFI